MADTELRAELNDIKQMEIFKLRHRLENCRDAAENSTTREQLEAALDNVKMVEFHMERAAFYA